MVELVCEILSELGSNKKIEAIGITGQMQNLVLLDETESYFIQLFYTATKEH